MELNKKKTITKRDIDLSSLMPSLTPTLSHRERENTQPVGPVSKAPPGD